VWHTIHLVVRSAFSEPQTPGADSRLGTSGSQPPGSRICVCYYFVPSSSHQAIDTQVVLRETRQNITNLDGKEQIWGRDDDGWQGVRISSHAYLTCRDPIPQGSITSATKAS
jgi:hypothetical protein